MYEVVLGTIIIGNAIGLGSEERLNIWMRLEVWIVGEAHQGRERKALLEHILLHGLAGHILDELPRGIGIASSGGGGPGIGKDQVGATTRRREGQGRDTVMSVRIVGLQVSNKPGSLYHHRDALHAKGVSGPGRADSGGQNRRGIVALETRVVVQGINANAIVERRVGAIVAEHRATIGEEEGQPTRRIGGERDAMHGGSGVATTVQLPGASAQIIPGPGSAGEGDASLAEQILVIKDA